jgi:electron-transferring-flavoprotein dehydrogenase
MTDTLEFDVLIAGAGPAGLACAVRLKQLRPELKVCVLEKGPEAGAHILSGAVVDPAALDELIPDWKDKGAPLRTKATRDRFRYLTETKAWPLPVLPAMRNAGCYLASVGDLCRWLAEQAAGLGVDVFPGFAAQEALFDGNRMTGVRVGDTGRDKSGAKTGRYQEGVRILAKHSVLAEGCRGHVTQTLEERYGLRAQSGPQTYGIGIKEIWELPQGVLSPGEVVHTTGWPLDGGTYGGSFLYHMSETHLAVGYVVGLDYRNPYLNPYEEFQRFKTHPSVRPLPEKGRRVAYGARALNEGGLQSIPQLTFPGGSVIGCAAGFLNVVRIKGTHTAMKSGMCLADALCEGEDVPEIATSYPERLKASFVYKELDAARNVRPAFAKWGRLPGMAYAALDQYLLRGKAPWTLHHHTPDHARLLPKDKAKPIAYPPHDGTVTFDRLASVELTGVRHAENQPCHLQLRRPDEILDVNCGIYGAPEERYCPAGVYEYPLDKDGSPYLQINAANCIHCKTCDIKDPEQNIRWVAPEGGDGPRYGGM